MTNSANKKLYIKTYGCQMNVYDSERMADVMRPLGFELSQNYKDADMVILNTCHIREKAAEKVYSDLGRIRTAKNKNAKNGTDMMIAVAGCVAQAEGEEIFRRAPYVDIVVGPQSYQTLPDLVSKIKREKGHAIDLEFEDDKFDKLPAPTIKPNNGSALVSIQEGCDKFCTFCVVPYTRGAEYSRPVEKIYRECLDLVSHGAKEITLLGQNVNAYHGVDFENNVWSLGKLINHIANIPKLERIRYSTSHPRDMHEELFLAHANCNKLMPFLNLPVQSGSDKILRAMNRKHNRKQYLDIIAKLRSLRPEMQFSSDFIIGFPDESEKDFEDTLDLAIKVNFIQAFSFAYSPRPGTPGADMENQVDDATKLKRLHKFQAQIAKQQLEFNQSCIGSIMEILPYREGKIDNQVIGKTPYMQSVHVKNFPEEFLGQIVKVKITDSYANSMAGELV